MLRCRALAPQADIGIAVVKALRYPGLCNDFRK